MKIDFLIIGAQKSGTTTLYNWLAQHPDIFLPETKEILYFAKDEFYRQGEKYFDIFYRQFAGQKVVGGAYVHLIYFPYAAERIHGYNPQEKIISVLRNPIDRAYSAYWFACSNGWETEKTFESALHAEERRAVGSYKEQAELTYLAHGRYAEQLQIYFDLFGKDQMLVVLTEQLKSDPFNVINNTIDFLGLSFDRDCFNLSADSNRSTRPRFPGLQKVLLSHETWYRSLGRKLLPTVLRYSLRERLTKHIVAWNRQIFRYPPMSPDTRKMLVEYFKPHNERLEKIIGMDLSAWNRR